MLHEAWKLQFFEISPNGERMWIEDLIGPLISESIARFLRC